MKTKPDDITLTQWMDGELDGDELIRVEAWVQEHPELLAERDAVQAMSASIREHVADSEEPPYPDFFNQRILRAIEEDQRDEQQAVSASVGETNSRGFWQWLLAPMAAGAMAVCFYLGTQVGNAPDGFGAPETGPVAIVQVEAASVYTPDGAVRGDMFKSDDAEATVIVLEGLDDLPDDLEMAGGPTLRTTTGSSDSMMISTEQDSRIY